MSHTFSRLLVHAIWSTKNREPLITSLMETQLFEFITTQFREMGCPLRIINGTSNHVHVLFFLSTQKSLADVIKQVKGASSHWVNLQDFSNSKFAWQTGFAAYSVSDSVGEKVYEYIKNQKDHHRKVTFQDEYDLFVQKITK